MYDNHRPCLVLARGREKSIERHHPWLFSGAVGRVVGSPQEGDLVDVCLPDGKWCCTGLYEGGSIIVKVLSFDSPCVDDAFFRRRLAAAVECRRRMGLFGGGTNVFRLVHAEGDFLPGLVADYYNGVVVLQAHSVGMHRLFPLLVPLFVEVLGGRCVSVFDKSAATLPTSEQASDGFRYGPECPEREVEEYGCRIVVNFYEGQKTGFFIDQRENRRLVGSLSNGCNVLNCFGYTGGFSVAALKGGAAYVETVDISKRAIALCERNVALNCGDNASHKGVVADVLQYMDRAGENFDLVILDPPAFAKNHHALPHALKAYRSINQKAMEKIHPGGLLFSFSCSQAVDADQFQTMAFSAANLAGRRVRIVQKLPHAPDHPVSIFHPEGEYLKGLLLSVE